VLVLFSDAVATGCGNASSSVGPFYCPPDNKLYIDPTFYEVMDRRLRAPGDFAQAYVIAHEVGHHVQKLIGATAAVDEARDTPLQNQMSVRLELQADCFAGVWGHDANRGGQLSPGDLQEALNAAHRIGDDTLQRQSQGYVRPGSFTHGSSDQRMRWFKQGFDTGDPRQCDTFAVRDFRDL
jgi:predicted metalloprotease